MIPRENKGTERETPSIALGICEFHLILDDMKTKDCFPRVPQTYRDACKCHLEKLHMYSCHYDVGMLR